MGKQISYMPLIGVNSTMHLNGMLLLCVCGQWCVDSGVCIKMIYTCILYMYWLS